MIMFEEGVVVQELEVGEEGDVVRELEVDNMELLNPTTL
jgi:hypothetical protein